MANPNPYQARLAQRRPRKPGDLRQLTRVLWRAILEAEEILMNAGDAELKLKAIHALSQCAGQYRGLIEVGEFESRLKALEDAKARRNGHASY